MNRYGTKALLGVTLLGLSWLAQAADWQEVGHVHDVAASAHGATFVAGHNGVFRIEDGIPVRVSSAHASSIAVLDTRLLLAGLDHDGKPGPLRAANLSEGIAHAQVHGPDSRTLAVVAGPDAELYAVAGRTLFFSGDSGQSWQRRGALPNKMIDLAAADTDSLLYAATYSGLMVSRDGGRRWQVEKAMPTPATSVAVRGDRLEVFQYKRGLQQGTRREVSDVPVSNDFGQQVPVRMVFAGQNELYATTNWGHLFMSTDGGERWSRVDRLGADTLSTAARRGKAIYQQDCVSCHGTDGVGEAPRLGELETGLAPALDETMHAWHHTDENLATIIRDGTSGRMPGWGSALSDGQIGDLVAYIKSLWDERALRCQGPAHMSRACQQPR